MNKTINENPVDGLERVLKEQLGLYRDYFENQKKDLELMTKLQIPELERSNKSKSTTLLKIQALDQAREAFVKQLAETYGLKKEKLRLGEICKALPFERSQRLFAIRDNLEEVITKLRSVQDQTKALATNSLTWINGSISALKSLLAPTATYNFHGQVESPTMYAGRTLAKQA